MTDLPLNVRLVMGGLAAIALAGAPFAAAEKASIHGDTKPIEAAKIAPDAAKNIAM